MHFFKKNKEAKLKKTPRKRKGVFFRVGIEKEREYFVENLSMMLSSGMVISQVIESLKEDEQSKRMQTILKDMEEDIEEGVPLWKALSGTGLFSEHAVSLLRIGEQSGKLAENMEVIREQEQKSRVFQSKVRSAMLYPAVVLMVMITVGIGIAWFILPKLARMFDSLHIQLPFLTRALIAFGEFISAYGTIAVPAFIVILFSLFYVLFVMKRTKFIGQAILFTLPGIKRLVREAELARMGYMLGSLLDAGVPIVISLEALRSASAVKRYQKIYEQLKKNVEAGESFKQSFRSVETVRALIPLSVQHMIVAGEQTGRLSDIFYRIGKTFELKTEDTTKNLSVLLEPILLFLVWIGVVLVALAVIMPIYSLIGGLRSASAPPPPAVSAPVSTEESAPTVESVDSAIDETESAKVSDETESGNAAAGAEVGELPKLRIAYEYLNVRQEPSAESDRIGRVFLGEEYAYDDYDTEANWYHIVVSEDISGWVSGEYVENL